MVNNGWWWVVIDNTGWLWPHSICLYMHTFWCIDIYSEFIWERGDYPRFRESQYVTIKKQGNWFYPTEICVELWAQIQRKIHCFGHCLSFLQYWTQKILQYLRICILISQSHIYVYVCICKNSTFRKTLIHMRHKYGPIIYVLFHCAHPIPSRNSTVHHHQRCSQRHAQLLDSASDSRCMACIHWPNSSHAMMAALPWFAAAGEYPGTPSDQREDLVQRLCPVGFLITNLGRFKSFA